MTYRASALAAAVATLAFLAVAYGVGMDRLAAVGEASPDSVPGPFRAEARIVAANQLLPERKYEASRIEAEAAIRALPLDVRATGLLGVNRYFLGQTLEANDAFTVSRRLGWRDLFTQAYWLEVAQRSGDPGGAAERVDALLRANPASPIVAASLTAIESDPAIRDALAQRMKRKPIWVSRYAASAAEITGPQFFNRLDVVTRAAAVGARAQCMDMRDAVASLLYRQNRATDARALWNVTCGSGREGPIGNGSFAIAVPEYASPFDWVLPGHGGVQANIENQSLVLDNTTSVGEVAASQTVLLPPGPFAIQWRASALRPDAGLGNSIGLTCPDGTVVELRAARIAGADMYRASGSIPPRCDRQVLGVVALPDAGRTVIDDIVLAGAAPRAP